MSADGLAGLRNVTLITAVSTALHPESRANVLTHMGLSEENVAVVIGATGGIGAALVQSLATSGLCTRVLALSRGAAAMGKAQVIHAQIDVTDEGSIRSAAEQAGALGAVRLVIVASGMLHEPGATPERSWSELDPAVMARLYSVNTIGPALVAKHFLPLLPRTGRAVFAALSARVGSIGDNQLGGWHSYRASKAALNMLIRNFAIELSRRAPEAICVGLHPGTVDTALSKPFQRSVQPHKLFAPGAAAGYLLSVVGNLQRADSGNVYAWDGAPIPA